MFRVGATPLKVMVAPELLVRLLSLKSQPLPLWVMVAPELLVMDVVDIVHVPESMVTVPLLVKAPPELVVVVGLAPREMAQPEPKVKALL